MKSFKRYISEDSLPEIYLDIDGVLADFEKGANKVLRANGYPLWLDESWNEFDEFQKDEIRWSLIALQEDFWETLPTVRESKKLFRFVEPYKPNVLSVIESRHSKKTANIRPDWLKEKFGSDAFYEIHLVEDLVKSSLAINIHGRPNVLIDDSLEHCQIFEECGGIAIHHQTVGRTITQLKKLGFKYKRKK
jgi:hypothetical protein